MSRYIDADALKEQCYKFANDVSRSAMAFVQGQINSAPTADVVEVRHGEWIPQYEGSRLLKCSVCGYEYCDLIECINYCGECGAKMDGGTREE